MELKSECKEILLQGHKQSFITFCLTLLHFAWLFTWFFSKLILFCRIFSFFRFCLIYLSPLWFLQNFYNTFFSQNICIVLWKILPLQFFIILELKAIGFSKKSGYLNFIFFMMVFFSYILCSTSFHTYIASAG